MKEKVFWYVQLIINELFFVSLVFKLFDYLWPFDMINGYGILLNFLEIIIGLVSGAVFTYHWHQENLLN